MDAFEAREARDGVRLAERTRWNPEGDDAFSITYYPTTPGFSPPWTVQLPAVWNKMLHEFLYALRAHHRHKAAARPKVILRWEDNWGNSVTPPDDAEQCRQVIESVVPTGTLVIMAKLNSWTVVKADGPPPFQVGPGPYKVGQEDFTERVAHALTEAERPAENYDTNG
jgi:hypothetical protein